MTTKPTLLLRGESTGSRRSTGKFRAVPKLPFKPTSFTIAEARAAVRDVKAGLVPLVRGEITIRTGPLKYVSGKARPGGKPGRRTLVSTSAGEAGASTSRPRRKR